MNHATTAKRYFELLERGDTEGIIGLFAPQGRVQSPLYGLLPAPEFYSQLAADTRDSRLEWDGLFGAEDGRLALVFYYNWTLASGAEVRFKVVDLLELDAQGTITQLEIIYDTALSRQLWTASRVK
ncbi:MAG: nuclear transport factor 2 family protein [Bacteroidota bacterium]